VSGQDSRRVAAFKNHLSYLPHSGSVRTRLEAELVDYDHTKGSLHFPIAETLPPSLVNNLVTARLAELGLEVGTEQPDLPWLELRRPGVLQRGHVGLCRGGDCLKAAPHVVAGRCVA
jgi:hypothetical protein